MPKQNSFRLRVNARPGVPERVRRFDETRVMVSAAPRAAPLPPLAPGLEWVELDHAAFAAAIGALRATPADQIEAATRGMRACPDRAIERAEG